MPRPIKYALLFLIMSVTQIAAADPPDGYEFLHYDQGLKNAIANNKKIFLYFGREGCGFCDVTNKKAFSAAAVRERYQHHYELVYVDSESGRRLTLPSGERITERDLAPRYKAFVTPVFVFLEPDGEPILKRVGIQTAEQLLAYDEFVSQGHYKQTSFDQYARAKH
jgi:thioredoxin-related protein